MFSCSDSLRAIVFDICASHGTLSSHTTARWLPEKSCKIICPSSAILARLRLNRLDVPITLADGQHQRPASSSLVVLTSLVDLNLAGNKFDAHSIEHSLGTFTKKGFPHLAHLDVRGSNLPVEEEKQELLRIRTVSVQAGTKATENCRLCLRFDAVVIYRESPNLRQLERACKEEPVVPTSKYSRQLEVPPPPFIQSFILAASANSSSIMSNILLSTLDALLLSSLR